MARIELTPTHLLVKLTAAEKIFSLHGDFRIPAALIRGATVAHRRGSKREAISITLVRAKGQRFKRLLLSTSDAKLLADQINDAILAC